MIKYLNFFSLIIACLLLASCCSQYGNFLDNDLTEDGNSLLSEDVTRQLCLLYYPAKTQINFDNFDGDNFGQDLIQKLREKGFAVREYISEPLKKTPEENYDFSLKIDFPEDKKIIHLKYLLDKVKNTNIYRVQLYLNDKILAHGYFEQDLDLYHAGKWSRKE